MTVALQVRTAPVRQFPEQGEEYGSDATSLIQDLVYGVNNSLQTGTVQTYFAVVGTATDVTNGIANYSDIQAAITACSDGDEIKLLPRTFVLASKLVINKKISIIGSGYNTIVGDSILITTGGIAEIQVEGVCINKLRLKQSAGTPQYAIDATATGKYALLDNIWYEGTFSSGKEVNDASGTIATGFGMRI